MSGMLVPVIILYIAIIVFLIASVWKVYVKAGQPGWSSIVPIYNFVVLLKIVGKPWWYLFLVMIPIVGIVYTIIIYNELSKSFGKEAGFTAGLILLGFVFFPILGFGKATYIGPGGIPLEATEIPNAPTTDFTNYQ